jgi:hypothetical protein
MHFVKGFMQGFIPSAVLCVLISLVVQFVTWDFTVSSECARFLFIMCCVCGIFVGGLEKETQS